MVLRRMPWPGPPVQAAVGRQDQRVRRSRGGGDIGRNVIHNSVKGRRRRVCIDGVQVKISGAAGYHKSAELAGREPGPNHDALGLARQADRAAIQHDMGLHRVGLEIEDVNSGRRKQVRDVGTAAVRRHGQT